MNNPRERLVAALAKRDPIDSYDFGEDVFDPWEDVITGIYGSYSSESDELMVSALIAVRDKATFEFIRSHGFAGEFALYVLAGHGYLEYGTSPRGGWPDPDVEDLWQPLIDRWANYFRVMWGEEIFDSPAETEPRKTETE